MKIKILLLNINELGGIERVAVNLCRMLLSNNTSHDVEIVSLNGTKLVSNCRFLQGSSESNKLYEFSKNIEADTIVLSLYDRLSIKLSIIRKIFSFKFRLFACQHADYFAHRLHTRALRRITYCWVDKIITLTKQDAQLYRKHFEYVYVIPNSLSFYPESVSFFSSRSINAAVAGRLVPIKQFDHFIHFLSNIEASTNNKIFGEGVERDKLYKLLSYNGLNGNDILVGKVENIEIELSNTKFFFVTSLRESFSMVILEAMACGCVVISYDCPTGPKELIEDGVNGFLVPLNDTEALINRYSLLVKNPDLCQKISDNARVFSKEFLDKSVINKWMDVFNGN